MNLRTIFAAWSILLALALPITIQAQEKSFIDNFSFEAKPVITTDYLKHENLKHLSPDNAEGLIERGFHRLAEGMTDEALTDFESVVSIAPTYGVGYYGIGICYKQKGDTTQAGSYFRKSIAKDATFGPSYLELGDMLIKNKPAAAEKMYHVAHKYMPESAEPLFRLSVTALSKNDVNSAKKNLKTAQALEPNHLPSIFLLAQIYFAERKFSHALDLFTKCIEIDQEHVEAYSWRAVCQASKRKYDEAIKDLNKGVEITPDNELLYILRAAIYYDKKAYR